MMINNQIKPDYSTEIAKFLAAGGTISPAVNTGKAEFNYCNADSAAESAKNPRSYKNNGLRTRARNLGSKSYTPVAPCNSCGTSERSVKSNACLECDRRRFRAKVGVNEDKLTQIGSYLLAQNKTCTFTSGGKKYVLKVEVA